MHVVHLLIPVFFYMCFKLLIYRIPGFCDKLCGKLRNMPPPLYAARRSPAPAYTRLTPAAPQRALRHEYS